jgi:hypothetical protein
MNGDFMNLEKKPGEKKDFSRSILILFLIFIFVVGFVAIKEYGFKKIVSDASEKIVNQTEEMFSLRERGEETEETKIETEEELEAITSTEKKTYKEVAERGDGLTHLARRAVTQYMEDEGIELSPEERIYAEDYIQKQLAPEKGEPRFLDIGEEIEISSELIEEGITHAETLTPIQIQNLGQYAMLVSF